MKKKHQITYEGNLSDDLRSFMCTTLKQALTDNVPEARKITRLVGFAIELLDNAQRYGENTRVEFKWNTIGEELTIEVKNIATKANAYRLRDQAKHVNSLTLVEIESEYKKCLMNTDFNQYGGAGLGLLQIMKNGAKSLQINIQELNSDVWSCVSSILVPLKVLEPTPSIN